jgi:hypothetical protein
MPTLMRRSVRRGPVGSGTLGNRSRGDLPSSAIAPRARSSSYARPTATRGCGRDPSVARTTSTLAARLRSHASPRVIDAGRSGRVPRGWTAPTAECRTAPPSCWRRHSHWDFETPAESQIQAELAGSNAIALHCTTLQMVDLQVFYPRESLRRDSLKIVVSPVRVRVSPSQEVPAKQLTSHGIAATLDGRLRATRRRKVPNDVPIHHGP